MLSCGQYCAAARVSMRTGPLIKLTACLFHCNWRPVCKDGAKSTCHAQPKCINFCYASARMQLSCVCYCFASAGMQPVAAPISSLQHLHRRSRDAEVTGGHRRRRTKQEQPTLVIMPDGTSLCFAVRDCPTTKPSASGSQDLPCQVIYTNPLANRDPSEAAASHAQPLSDAHILPPNSVMAGSGSTESGAALPGSVPQLDSQHLVA